MSYLDQLEAVHTSLRYIEDHLHEPLTLREIARHASFSEFYFHRLFHNHVGMPIGDYIRKRRLSNAACELLVTENRILDIAIKYQFESQEAFTRAFKKMFYTTPARYRRKGLVIIKNKESAYAMETGQTEPKGWILTGSNTYYEAGTDHKVVHHGKASGYLKSTAEVSAGFGTLMQMFKADSYRGKRLQLSGFVKTKDVAGWSGLWMRIDGKDEEILMFDNMQNRPLKGTLPWTRCHVVLDVPSDSIAIGFGVILSGTGQVWVDNLRFDVVDQQVPTTNLEEENELPDEPINLNFETD